MRNSILLMVLVGTFLYANIDKFGQKVSKGLENRLIEAKKLRLASKFEASKKRLDTLIAQKPDYYGAYYNVGLLYLEVRKYEEATVMFEKALKIHRAHKLKDTSIYNTTGWSYVKAQNYKRAEKYFKQGIALEHNNARYINAALYSNLGLVYFYTQRFEKALNYLRIAKERYGSTSSQETIDIIKALKAKAPYIFVCYAKKERVNAKIRYIECQRSSSACGNKAKESFGKYKTNHQASQALKRCLEGKPHL